MYKKLFLLSFLVLILFLSGCKNSDGPASERALAKFHKCSIDSDCSYFVNPYVGAFQSDSGCYNKIELAKEFCIEKEKIPGENKAGEEGSGYRCRLPTTDEEIQQALSQLKIDDSVKCGCSEQEVRESGPDETGNIPPRLVRVCVLK